MTPFEALPTPPQVDEGCSEKGATLLYLAGPQREGFSISAVTDQQVAMAGLPQHEVSVVKRSNYKDAVHTADVSYYQELSEYSDGTRRLATIMVPKQPVTDVPVRKGDAWFTSESGYNAITSEMIAKLGFIVVHNHHQGRQLRFPTTPQRAMRAANSTLVKSLARSAAQDHALLDDLSRLGIFDPNTAMSQGESRSAMTGEAFIALGAQALHRNVLWSDHEAPCFAHGVGALGFFGTLLKQLPNEVQELKIIAKEIGRADPSLQAMPLNRLAGTFDPHPMNIVDELGWWRPLKNGDAGKYSQAIPLSHRGVRTVYTRDLSSQGADWQSIQAPRLGIALMLVDGAHMSIGRPLMTTMKRERFANIREYALEHDGDLSNMTYRDVLPQSMLMQVVKAA